MIFIFFSLLHAIIHKFPYIAVHDSYIVSRHFEKCYSHWAASVFHISAVYFIKIALPPPIRTNHNHVYY